jgi:hypothetical protein
MKNNRTFLEKLLDGAEVEWKTLDEISSIYGGLTGKGKADFENGNALYVPYKNIFNNIEVDFNNLETVNVSDDEKQYTIKYGDVLFTGSSETAEEAGMSSAVTTKIEQKIYLNSFSFGLRFNDDVELLPEFSKFLFRTLSIRKEIVKSASGVTRFNISKARFKKIKIPIPPLSVQTEIVKILDALTALTSELTSELTLRRKQYEYYREKLLSEEELGKVGGEWKNLKDILINLRTGLNPRNNFKLNTDGAENYYITVRELDSVNIKITDKTDKISNQAREIIDKRSKLNIGDILFSGTGTIGKTAFISELPRNWNIKEGVYALTVNQEIIKPMYLLRLLQSEITKKQINNFVMGSTVKSISMADLKKVKILIPSLDEQQRIVSILDKFETLTNSITEGLPLAIEQSQKRYEYYRELLLNFS